VEALRKAGRTVAITSRLGDGFPDLVVARLNGSGLARLIEVKPLEALSKDMLAGGPWSMSRRKLLTPAERKFHESWPVLIPIVVSIEEALEVTRC
jgi:hypothetical protein